MEQYQAAYPAVELFSAPGLEDKRKDLAFAGLLGAPRILAGARISIRLPFWATASSPRSSFSTGRAGP